MAGRKTFTNAAAVFLYYMRKEFKKELRRSIADELWNKYIKEEEDRNRQNFYDNIKRFAFVPGDIKYNWIPYDKLKSNLEKSCIGVEDYQRYLKASEKVLTWSCEKAKNEMEYVISNLYKNKRNDLEEYFKKITNDLKIIFDKKKVKAKIMDEIKPEIDKMSAEWVDKLNKEQQKNEALEKKLKKLKDENKKETNEEIEKLQENIKYSNGVLKLILDGFDNISAERDKLVQEKFEEKKNALETNLMKTVQTSMDDLYAMKADIDKEVVERMTEFDELSQEEFLKRMREKMSVDITKLMEGSSKFQNQKFERKLKYADIVDKLKISVEELEDNFKKGVDQMLNQMNLDFKYEDELEDLDSQTPSSN